MPPRPIESQSDRPPIVNAAVTISVATARPMTAGVRRATAVSILLAALRSDSAIRMQPAENVVPEVGEDHRGERNQKDHRAAAAPPATQRTGVEVDPVDEPGERSEERRVGKEARWRRRASGCRATPKTG